MKFLKELMEQVDTVHRNVNKEQNTVELKVYIGEETFDVVVPFDSKFKEDPNAPHPEITLLPKEMMAYDNNRDPVDEAVAKKIIKEVKGVQGELEYQIGTEVPQPPQ